MFAKVRIGVAALLAFAVSPSVAHGETTATAGIERAATNIARTEQTHRAWLSLDLVAARAQAELVASAPLDSPLRQLNGLVVAVKDNVDTNWLPATAGARALRNRRPTRNATVVERILAAGGVIPGKTNMDTFARGVRTISELGGQTRNAVDPTKSPGGSSGGTAVAVALRNADAGIGTDTCGSLRYPAAYNGIYGLRPTLGLVSRAGIIPLSPAHDVVGPMARTPQDLAQLLGVIAGRDGRDPATAMAPNDSYADISTFPSGGPLRIGVLRDRGAYTKSRTNTSPLTLLMDAGMELVDVTLPPLGLPNVINEEFGVLKPKILAGVLSDAEWLGGVAVINTRAYRSKLARMADDRKRLVAFLDSSRLDAVVYPTTRFPAAALGSPQPSTNCSLSASTGTPAIALPFQAPSPGIDVLGRPFSERLLLQIAAGYEIVRTREQ